MGLMTVAPWETMQHLSPWERTSSAAPTGWVSQTEERADASKCSPLGLLSMSRYCSASLPHPHGFLQWAGHGEPGLGRSGFTESKKTQGASVCRSDLALGPKPLLSLFFVSDTEESALGNGQIIEHGRPLPVCVCVCVCDPKHHPRVHGKLYC